MPVTPIPAAIAPSGIKSIQRGTITIGGANLFGTATISAVNPVKAQVQMNGCTVSSSRVDGLAYLEITNTTTVKGTRSFQDGITETILSFQVTEWY